MESNRALVDMLQRIEYKFDYARPNVSNENRLVNLLTWASAEIDEDVKESSALGAKSPFQSLLREFSS